MTSGFSGSPAPHTSRSEISKYGIVDAKAAGNRTYELRGMVEKPAPEKAPSEFAIMGRYVLTPDIFELLAQGKPGAGGEIQLGDSVRAVLDAGKAKLVLRKIEDGELRPAC